MNNVIFNLNRQTFRAPTNEMDKCTVFSIFPRDIEERKVTLDPFKFVIPAGTNEKPGRLEVNAASWWKDVEPEQPLIEIPVNSVVVARSIVEDYVKGIYGFTVGKRSPGVFYIPGDISIVDLKSTKYIHLLTEAIKQQRAWYEFLCTAGDVLWARSNGNPLAVLDDMRLAAKELHMDKEWMKNTQASELIRCINCGELRNPQFPTCKHCHAIIDKELAKKIGILVA